MKDETTSAGLPGSKDKVLFTPGPLTTSRTVKQAMLRDLGSRDRAFIDTVKDIRQSLVRLAGGSEKDFTAIPMQGSGTFGLEAVVSSAIPRGGKLLVAINGAYGKRIAQIAAIHGIPVTKLEFPEDQMVQAEVVAQALEEDRAITHACVVHCETTTGIVNPIREMGDAVRRAGRLFFVDAMSSFGAIPIHLEEDRIDYLVSSSNKCIEGVPGFSFVLARLDPLRATEGWARTLSLDLLAQHRGLEKDGQFRFTPATHALLAFHQALQELEAEGGIEARAHRYRSNHAILVAGMRRMGFKEYLRPEDQGHIITSFLCPKSPAFRLDRFYDQLSRRGFVIYPGKVSTADCFRIGSIGRIFPADMEDLLSAIRRTLEEMGLPGPLEGA